MKRGVIENERNLVEDESILSSLDESSTDDNSDEKSISTDSLKDIQDGNYVHLNINARYARWKYVTVLVKQKVERSVTLSK